MRKQSLREILVPTCMLALFLTPPSESFKLGGHRGGNLGDLLTASIIGLAIGGMRDRLKKQQELKPFNLQQPKASANNQRARFMSPFPLQGMIPLQEQIPIMQASHMFPTFQQQMFQPQPVINDMSPFLMWSPEEIYAPMASHLMHPVPARQPLNSLQDGFPTLEGFGDMATIQRQWQTLESQAIRTLLAYGGQ